MTQPSPRMPWGALLTLSATTFVVVTGEMLPTAVLPHMATALDVPVSQVGLLVSLWAAVVVVTTLPLARLAVRFDRRRVIVAALGVVSLAHLMTALSTAFHMAAAARVVGAAATGLLWATVNAQSADLVPATRLARATAIVLAGATAGTILAVPAGNAAADWWGWRAAFLALFVLTLLVMAAVAMLLPAAPRSTRDRADHAGAGSGRPLWPVFALGGLGGLVLAAHFVAFTFVTATLAARGSEVSTAALLLMFGLAGAGGVALVARMGERFPDGTLVAVAALVAASLAFTAKLGNHPAADVAIMIVWGTAVGAVGPAVQTAIMRAADVQHRDTAGAVLPITFNLGIAAGAALGSALVAASSVATLPLAATALAAMAAVGLLLAGRTGRVDRRPVAPAPASARAGNLPPGGEMLRVRGRRRGPVPGEPALHRVACSGGVACPDRGPGQGAR
ncbi:MFS transporter [Blastococcus sp. SYSU DS0616]